MPQLIGRSAEDLDWQRLGIEKFFQDDSPDETSMTPFESGDVVSVEFPFSDFQAYKRRPGLVLIAGEMDLLIARLTTHPPREPSDMAMKRWSEIGFHAPQPFA